MGKERGVLCPFLLIGSCIRQYTYDFPSHQYLSHEAHKGGVVRGGKKGEKRY